MNEHDLDLALESIGARRTRVTASAALRDRARAVPLETPQRRFLPPITGRSQSMFNVTKFVVAGAIVALFGGVLLTGFLTQPGDEQMPAVGASASDPRWPDPEGATTFRGRIAEGDKILEEVTDAEGSIVGGLETAIWVDVSDPRLDGTITIATSATGSGLGPTMDSDVLRDAYRIVTTDGAWVGEPSAWFWLEDDTISSRVHILSGEGAYEGLTALMELSGDLSWNGPIEVAGIIYEGELPQPPPFSLVD